ncbi:MAG: TadE/TadG family type IV pilus assembly protein [Sneathiella sp.]
MEIRYIQKRYRLPCCDQGSVLVETALILPFIFLLIFVGVDLVRLIELTSRVNQSSAVIANNLGRQAQIDDAEIFNSLALAYQVMGNNRAESSLSLKISAISIQRTKGTAVLWARLLSEEAETCGSNTPDFSEPSTQFQESKAINFFVVVDLCVVPKKAFYISHLHLANAMHLRSLSIYIAAHPAIRTIE